MLALVGACLWLILEAIHQCWVHSIRQLCLHYATEILCSKYCENIKVPEMSKMHPHLRETFWDVCGKMIDRSTVSVETVKHAVKIVGTDAMGGEWEHSGRTGSGEGSRLPRANCTGMRRILSDARWISCKRKSMVHVGSKMSQRGRIRCGGEGQVRAPPGSPVCESLCCSEGLGAGVTMAWLGFFLMSQLKATGGGKS